MPNDWYPQPAHNSDFSFLQARRVLSGALYLRGIELPPEYLDAIAQEIVEVINHYTEQQGQEHREAVERYVLSTIDRFADTLAALFYSGEGDGDSRGSD